MAGSRLEYGFVLRKRSRLQLTLMLVKIMCCAALRSQCFLDCHCCSAHLDRSATRHQGFIMTLSLNVRKNVVIVMVFVKVFALCLGINMYFNFLFRYIYLYQSLTPIAQALLSLRSDGCVNSLSRQLYMYVCI